MPRNSIVATRYVRALIESKGGTRGLEACYAELRVFWGAVSSQQDLLEFFMSPVVSRELKLEAVAALKGPLKESSDFIMTLIDGSRLDSLPEIMEAMQLALEDAAGEMSVTVELARMPDAALLEEIKSLLQERWRKKVNMKTVVRPELIGGFVARGQGKILDASVVSQLDSLKQSLSSHS